MTVVSDPEPPVQFAAAGQSASAAGGSFSVAVTPSGPSTVDTVVYFTLGGTAAPGTDIRT